MKASAPKLFVGLDALDDIVRTACAWHLARPAGFAS